MALMKSYKFAEDNRELKAPLNWNEEQYGPCAPLNVHIDADNACYISRWRPSFGDRIRLLFGRPVQVTLAGMQPPIIVEVL